MIEYGSSLNIDLEVFHDGKESPVEVLQEIDVDEDLIDALLDSGKNMTDIYNKMKILM